MIVAAQLLGTSLWFSANASFDAIAAELGLKGGDLSTLTIAVQLGFILGTLCFAVSALADRFRASRIFAVSAVAGALVNVAFAHFSSGLPSAACFRFLTGVSLAGVYPLGMKLVVSWNPARSGEALGWLVAMLTVGTASPHAIRWLGVGWDWQYLADVSSLLAVCAAVAVYSVGDGPFLALKTPEARLRWAAVMRAFRLPEFRASALGYFGHMWELYAFWTLVPFLIAQTLGVGLSTELSLVSFAVIAVGGLGCVLGGYASRRLGSAAIAATALSLSALCGLVYPLLASAPLLALSVLFVWGVSVVADSPQFSALSAKAAPADLVGSALAMQNCIGFGITVIAIHVSVQTMPSLGAWVAWLLVPGPIAGLVAVYPLIRPRYFGKGESRNDPS